MNQHGQTTAHWRGSEKTADAVREEIANRWGAEEAEQYDPMKNCFTLQTCNILGYKVKKGEKAIRSMTLVEVKDETEEGEEAEVHTYPKTVYLFYIKQVKKK